MKVLVTGITGFIATHLTERLIAAGHHVIGIGRKENEYLARRYACSSEYVWQGYDFFSQQNDSNAIDYIVHAAGQSPYNSSCISDFVFGNIRLTEEVIAYAKTFRTPILYLSTVSIYGRISVPIIDENTEIVDPCSYGLTKRVAEKLLEDASCYIPVLCMRLPGILGNGARNTLWITRMVNGLILGNDIHFYNGDHEFNNVVHINDLTTFIRQVLYCFPQKYDLITLASEGSMRIREVLKLLHTRLKSTSKLSEELSNKRSFRISIDKAKRIYGYQAMSVQDCLTKYIQEYTSTQEIYN